MKIQDSSIFNGVKEFGIVRFEDAGATWLVRELTGEFWVYVGTLLKLKGETDDSLLQRWYTIEDGAYTCQP
jgi:hypothetical protein